MDCSQHPIRALALRGPLPSFLCGWRPPPKGIFLLLWEVGCLGLSRDVLGCLGLSQDVSGAAAGQSGPRACCQTLGGWPCTCQPLPWRLAAAALEAAAVGGARPLLGLSGSARACVVWEQRRRGPWGSSSPLQSALNKFTKSCKVTKGCKRCKVTKDCMVTEGCKV